MLVLAALCSLFAMSGLLVGGLVAVPAARGPVLLGVVALVYVAFFVWQPEVALLSYIALRPLVDAFVFEGFGGFTLGALWGLGMIVSACFYLVMQSLKEERGVRLSGVPLAFLFFLAALTLTRPDLMIAFYGLMKVASWVLLMVACEWISRDRRGQLRCWWAGIAMGAALVASVGIMIAQDRFGGAFYSDPLRGVSGQLPHPLAIGAVLLLPFALAGALLYSRKITALAVSVGLLGAVLLSYVRTALIGVAIVLSALLVVTVKGGGRTRTVGLVVAAGAVVAVYAIRARIAERFADLTLLTQSGAAQGGAGSGRLAIWSAALTSSFDSLQHAVIGRGAGAVEEIMVRAVGFGVGAQNDLLDFLVAGGLLLSLCFLVLLAWMVASPAGLLRDPRQSQAATDFAILALGGVIAFVVMSMINGIATYQPSVAAGLLVGLVRGMAATPGKTFLDDVGLLPATP